MSCSRPLNFRPVQDFLPEVGTQVLGCPQVDCAPREKFRKRYLHPGDAQQPGNAVRFELDQQVDIAVGPEVIAQC